MKTAKILRKSVLNLGNNWITLLNSAKIIKKNAVTPVNFHLYHYAGNNPVRYTDPDGRKIATLLCFEQQNSADNKNYSMGKTPSGVFNEKNELQKQNKIGSYGCKFISTFNIANTIRQNSRECRDACSVGDYAENDAYFCFSDLVEYGKHEGWTVNNANMGDAQMEKLLKDTTGHDYSVSSYRGQKYVRSMIKLFQRAKEKVYAIAEVKTKHGSHFINIFWDDEKDNLSWHDTYIWNNPEIEGAIAQQIYDRNFRLIIIREQGDKILK